MKIADGPANRQAFRWEAYVNDQFLHFFSWLIFYFTLLLSIFLSELRRLL
jgi:hypothetical protein